jgi:REP element-mobilizing transposase RayT
MFGASDYWFITVRNFQARKLMTPRSPRVREVCGGVLARAAHRHEVKLLGYVFLSNHFHLIIHARGVGVAEFMKYLLSNLAKKLAPLCGEPWWGRFWERRYSAAPILDEKALETRLHYVLSHGVKEGLVASPLEWEGLHCAGQIVSEAPLSFRWFDWTRRWNAKNRPSFDAQNLAGRYSEEFSDEEQLVLEPLPQWARMPQQQRRQAAEQMVRDIELLHRKERVIGMARVKNEGLDPPVKRKRTNRPMCHSASWVTSHRHRLDYWAFADAFRAASGVWRTGKPIEFPRDCFKPFISSEIQVV